MQSVLNRNNVTVLGAGAVTLVLAHGLGTDQSVWREMLSWATARYRVVLFDLMGAASTDPQLFDLNRYGSIDGYVDDLLHILHQTQTRRCILIGHSAGAMIGLKAAIERPDLFERIVMLNCSPCYLDHEDYVGGFDAAKLEALFDAIRENYHHLVAQQAPIMLGTTPDDPAVAEFARGMLRLKPDVALSMALTFFRCDLRADIPRLRVPALIVHSRRDPVVPLSVAAYLQHHATGAQLAFIDAPGHLPHLTAPAQVIAAIEPYLAG